MAYLSVGFNIISWVVNDFDGGTIFLADFFDIPDYRDPKCAFAFYTDCSTQFVNRLFNSSIMVSIEMF